MISRYQSKEFSHLWSDQNRYDSFLKIELAVAKAWENLGKYDNATYEKIKIAKYNLNDVYEMEKETKHDVIAFTRVLTKSLQDEKKWIHYGLTSTDVVDSAQALILKEANNIIKNKVMLLLEELKEKALRYKKLPSMGRTHGIHAEISSFGLKFVLWYEDLKRIYNVFILACQNIEVIKISGAVGNYAANTYELEEEVSKILDMQHAKISTQVLQRDRHAQYINSIALLGSQLEKIATEIRHLSRTEVNEVSEYFSDKQKGSSAMPHKKNPIGSENIVGLSRVLRGYTITAFENINLWHERDISHSSAERVILADATTLIDYMLTRMTNIIKGLIVNEENILNNIELTKGVIFSQHVLSKLISAGMNREEAYDLVQVIASKALNNKVHFKTLLLDNKRVLIYLTNEEVNEIFNINYLLRYVNVIYKRVFE
ncbi:MAG: adenylosuccinate lyase [Acholeplasma sp.]|nr:adenylosuccinate lyase [Acholeplasma sp.]